FLILHLKDFFYEYRIEGLGDETIFDEVIESFHIGWYITVYIFAFVLLGFHLNHGFQSAFQTLGLGHREYSSVIKAVGTAFAVIITIGFVIIPLAVFFDICN
ncbi:MAG: succinate dehydrogenase, partial [Flavobacteriales bacterium]